MHELRPIGWYASRITPHLPKEAFQAAPERLWGGLALLLIQISAMAAIAIWDLHWALNLTLALVISQTFAGLAFLSHEVLHGTVVKTAWMRDLAGAIGFLPFWIGSKLWRKWHNMEHHAHTQHEHDDPDCGMTMEYVLQTPFIRWAYKLHPDFRSFFTFAAMPFFFQVHANKQLARYIGDFKPSERRIVWLQLLLPVMLWTALLFVMGPYKWLFAYLIPLLIANFIMVAYILTNHDLNPITDVNDPLANSLSLVMPKWIDLIHFNFSHHVEHHLYPGMNPKYAPLVRAKLREMFPEQYFEMSGWQAMVALWKLPRVYKDKVEKVDIYYGEAYDLLGHGLDPADVAAKKVDLRVPGSKFPGASLESSPAQGD